MVTVTTEASWMQETVSNYGNESVVNGSRTLPPELQFSHVQRVKAIAYFCLFWVSATLNLMVIVTLLCNSRRAISHVNRFVIHLCVANLIVTFIMMPLEVRVSHCVSIINYRP